MSVRRLNNLSTKQILWLLVGVWLGGTIILVAALGFGHRNNSFQIQNEFKLINWTHWGIFSINRAVVYLFLASILTTGTMLWISRRMQARPNKVQTAVEVLFSLLRDNITRGNMPDAMARTWFPFLGALFLFLWWSNIIGYLPLPTNSAAEVQSVRGPHPVVRAVRRDREHLGSAGPGDRRVRHLQRRRDPASRARSGTSRAWSRAACTVGSCC